MNASEQKSEHLCLSSRSLCYRASLFPWGPERPNKSSILVPTQAPLENRGTSVLMLTCACLAFAAFLLQPYCLWSWSTSSQAEFSPETLFFNISAKHKTQLGHSLISPCWDEMSNVSFPASSILLTRSLFFFSKPNFQSTQNYPEPHLLGWWRDQLMSSTHQALPMLGSWRWKRKLTTSPS